MVLEAYNQIRMHKLMKKSSAGAIHVELLLAREYRPYDLPYTHRLCYGVHTYNIAIEDRRATISKIIEYYDDVHYVKSRGW